MGNNILKGNLIDGRAIASEMFAHISAEAHKLTFKPLLCDVIVGSDAVSLSYVKIKEKKALECGLDFSLIHLPSADTEEIISKIKIEQTKPNLCGLIVQLPLPENVDADQVLRSINPEIDVDLINPDNSDMFYANSTSLVPPTPGAIMHILEQLPTDLSVESFLVLGQGELVGRPIAHMLKERGYEVNVATSDTSNRAELLKSATIIISGVGKSRIINGEDISEGVIVIDAGTSESGGSIHGDVDFDTVAPKARYITPSPGGVGPVTVAKLLENVLAVAKSKKL